MAMSTASFSSFSAASRHRKPDSTVPRASSSNSWWTPLFGWPSDPDYISSSQPSKTRTRTGEEAPAPAAAQPQNQDMGRPRSKFGVGCFTEEKAKELRKKTAETSVFHDIMYHSAIASRLASDVSGRPDL